MRASAKVFSSLIAIVVSVPALASEFYQQTPPSVFEYTVELETQYIKSVYENNALEDAFDSIISLQMERGMGDTWSLGAWVGFGYGEAERFDVDQESVGLEDLEFYAKAFRPYGDSSLRYGLSFFLSPFDRSVDSDQESNRVTGGYWAKVYLGYEHIHALKAMGFRVSHEFSLGDRTEDTETAGDIDVTGSEEFEVTFYMEQLREDGARWGGSFSYVLTSDREVNGVASENMSPVIKLQAYRPTAFRNRVLIPSFTLGFGIADQIDGADLDEHSQVKLSLAYRF